MPSSIGGLGARGAVPLGDGRGIRVDGLARPGGVTFADTLKKALGDVVELQDQAKDAIAAFVRGEPVELHQVMAAAEEAGIALELLIEVRNKLVEAYRTVIGMQA
jgi:flagellar hook-basal body complex protein FliE